MHGVVAVAIRERAFAREARLARLLDAVGRGAVIDDWVSVAARTERIGLVPFANDRHDVARTDRRCVVRVRPWEREELDEHGRPVERRFALDEDARGDALAHVVVGRSLAAHHARRRRKQIRHGRTGNGSVHCKPLSKRLNYEPSATSSTLIDGMQQKRFMKKAAVLCRFSSIAAF